MILDPDPATPPVAPVCETVQENVVPATLLVSGIEVVDPEQIVVAAGVAVTFGTGLTVIGIVSEFPGQAPEMEVTV